MLERKNLARLGLVVAIAAVAILLILWRYVSLMLLTPEGASQENASAIVERGPILDRNGRVLAIQTTLDSVTAWIPDIDAPEETTNHLASALMLSVDSVRSILESRAGFAYVKRKISQSESEAIQSLIDDRQLRGIRLIAESARTYPEQKTAATILGIVDIDNNGLEGLELQFDSILLPTPDDGAEGEYYGNQIFLTIDLTLQYIAEQIAEATRDEQKADSVMVIAMDARNGEILAMAGAPGFNPNTFGSYPPANRANRHTAEAFEPGSVFKVFSVSAFLEIGASPHETFFCNGYYEHPDIPEPIKCLGVHGEVGFFDIIKYSCNAGAAYASELVESEAFFNVIENYGFGHETTLPFPGESNGLLTSPDSRSPRTKPTMAFGQEISTSAVQIVAAATAFTNSGVRLEPHIVKRIVSPDGRVVESFGRTSFERVISQEAAAAMLLMMEEATHAGGTATRAQIDGVRVSAKTGTAQVFNTETGSYSDEQFVASCLAIFPTDDPQVIVYVVIQNPSAGETFGGRIAAPVVSEFGNELVSFLGIPRVGDSRLVHSGVVTLPTRESIQIGSVMPDLTGYSKRDILPMLSIEEISVSIHGEGWVTRQEPAPGTELAVGSVILLELE